MKSFRKFGALALSTLLLLGLTACGGSSEEAAETTPEDASGNEVWVMTAGEQPFANVETLQSETHEDGTYYYADVTEDGQIIVVNTVLRHDLADPGVQSDRHPAGFRWEIITLFAGKSRKKRKEFFAADASRREDVKISF